MKKSPFILFMLFCMLSCSNKLLPGKYLYGKLSQLSIDSSMAYHYKSIKYGKEAFSEGKVVQNLDTISFLIDSNFIFAITSMDSKFDPNISAGKEIKIVSDNLRDITGGDYLFYIYGNDFVPISFDSNGICKYLDLKWNNQFYLYVKQVINVVPEPAHESLRTEKIETWDIQQKWNVLTLHIHFNPRMFNFVQLNNLLYRKGALISMDYPKFYRQH